MKGYVYVLLSLKDRRTYVGSTSNVGKRVQEHVNGRVISTRNRLPIKLIFVEEFETLTKTRRMERYYKSCSGRKKLAIILQDKLLPLW